MTLSLDDLKAKAAEYAVERDDNLKRIEALKLEIRNCVDAANTAHGAFQATQKIIEDTEEAAKKSSKRDKGKKT